MCAPSWKGDDLLSLFPSSALGGLSPLGTGGNEDGRLVLKSLNAYCEK